MATISKEVDDKLLEDLAEQVGYHKSEGDGPKEFITAIQTILLDNTIDPIIKTLIIHKDDEIQKKRAELDALIAERTNPK